MAPNTTSKASSRVPSTAFHMNTRRRSKQHATSKTTDSPQADAPEAPALDAEKIIENASTPLINSSPLSSPPESFEATPQGLKSALKPALKQDGAASKKRKVSFDVSADELHETSHPSKTARTRTPVESDAEPEIASAPAENVQLHESTGMNSRKRKSGRLAASRQNLPETNAPGLDIGSKTLDLSDTPQESDYPSPPDSDIFPTHMIWYAADATTRYNPEDARKRYSPTDANMNDSPEDEPPTSNGQSPRKPTRGGGRRGRGRGGRMPNGAGRGRGRSREPGDKDDSPEPPSKKHVLTEEQSALIAALKARQQELKKFFHTVGAQQKEALDLLASRDIVKLARKPKAHTKVPEYEATIAKLDAMREQVDAKTRQEYEMRVEHENKRFEREKYIIDQNLKRRVENAHKEHIRLVEAKIAMAEQEERAAKDDSHTDVDEDEYPQRFSICHPNPRGERVRGYDSHHIFDETPLKQQFAFYRDQVNQDVINEDVIGPFAKELEKGYAQHRREQAEKKTQTMAALSEEGAKRLKEIPGYLLPRQLTGADMRSFALSALADVSEFHAQRYPNQTYHYMPLQPGTHFPADALNWVPPPMPPHMRQRTPSLSNKPPPPQQQQQQRAPKLPMPPRAAPPQSPAQQQQQHQHQQQFVFQPPQQFFRQPPQSVAAVQPPPPPPPPIEVRFINSTKANPKVTAKGAGLHRPLLPKGAR